MKKITLSFLLIISIFEKSIARNTYAVIVGVSHYANLPIKNQLHFADADAKLFFDFLRSYPGGNVPKENITILLNENATYNNIVTAITHFQKAKKKDRIIFYFSGHGDKGMFMPYDVNENGENILFHKLVKQAFKESISEEKLMIADACMSGSMKKRTFNVETQNELSENKNSEKSKGNVIIMMASHKNETSAETGLFKQGIFSYYLIWGCRGEADSNSDKKVTIKELYDYVSKNVYNQSKAMGKPYKPIFFGQFSEDYLVSIIE